jgi:hypothetical protein
VPRAPAGIGCANPAASLLPSSHTAVQKGRGGRLDDTNQRLTNAWNALSQFARNEANDTTTPPRFIGAPIGTVNNLEEVQHYVAMIQSGHGDVVP